MKLYYNKHSKNPITTTKNVERIGKHSELLQITDDPLAYAKARIDELNKQRRSGRSEFTLTVDFNQTVLPSDVTLEFMKTFDKKDPKNTSYYNDFAYKVICYRNWVI